jgi:hypothetical protein
MPVNPNIALGAQTPAPVNFLGQMGQMLALKGAAQEIQGGEELRAAYASGGNINDPEFQRKIMAANPKLGAQLIKTSAETQRISGEALGTAYKNSREALSLVRSPEDLLSYSISQFNDPLIGPYLKARGLTPESVTANLQKELSTSGFENVLKKSAMGLDGWFKDQTSRRNQDVSSGASYGQLALAREKDAREVAQQQEISALMRGGSGAPTNALAPQSQQNTNALAAPTGDVYDQISGIDTRIAQLMNTGNPKAAPIVQQLNTQRNSLLASAKQQYGGPLSPMETIDPATNRPTTVQGQLDQYGRLRPVEMVQPTLSVDARAGGSTTISPNVARPAPTPAVIKERQAIEKLPEAIAMSQDAIRKIDEMIGSVDAKGKPLTGAKGQPHPGFSSAVGFGGSVPRFFAGTEAKNFEIRHNEVLSQAFLDAFETLKGGGAITEKEGEKATAARTRMNLATSEKEYAEAAREYQGVLKRGIESARQRAQRGGVTTPTSTGGIATDPSIQSLLDKYK